LTDHLKVVCIGDLQLPWTDYRALDLWFTMMKWWKPTNVVFTGDIDDQLEYSSFADGGTDEFFNRIKKSETESPLPFIKEYAEAARSFYTDVRKAHRRAEMFSCLGNHEARVFKYVDRKSPLEKKEVTPNFLYDFDKLGIDHMMYSEKPRELFPGVYFHHGKTTSTSGAAVRSDIDAYGVSLVRGHDHAGAVVYKTYPLTQKTLFGLACGHMCDPNLYGLQYAINPNWELGFGILHIYGNEVHPQFIHIKPDYTAVLDGKLFEG
jgi:hypothetical protein